MKTSAFSEENLHAFVCTARLASFSEAAHELGMTTSGVSYLIKRLETLLDVRLFIRSTRHVALTEAGRYFYLKAQTLLDDFRYIEKGVGSIDRGVEPSMRICINNLLHTPHHTTTLIRLLKATFPHCMVRIQTEVYDGVWDALRFRNADFAVGAPGILNDGGGINYVEMKHVHWRFVIAPAHPLASLPEPIPESLLRHYPAVCIDDTASRMIKRTAWLLHGQEPLFVPDMDSKQLAQERGLGIGFLPDYRVWQPLREGRLIEKRVQNPRQPSLMLAAWKASLKGKVACWLQQQFRPGNTLAELYRDLSH
jgi:LysR family transcriptional regulator, transcriptional activator of the allD operon